MANLPTQFSGVTVVTKANVYFDGKVVSHSVLFADGTDGGAVAAAFTGGVAVPIGEATVAGDA